MNYSGWKRVMPGHYEAWIKTWKWTIKRKKKTWYIIPGWIPCSSLRDAIDTVYHIPVSFRHH